MGTTHEEYVLACLATGKQVFGEKPLATKREACDRIIDAEVALRRLVSVASCAATTRSTGVEGVVTSGKAGAPLMMHAAHHNPSLPEFVLAFDAEFQARIDAVTAGGTTGPSASDGYAATVMCGTGLAALHSGARESVVLPERPDLYK